MIIIKVIMTNKKILKYQEKIAKLQKQIEEEQQKCKHDNITGKYGSDIGNWDRSEDSYWLDVKCLECGLRWHYTSDEIEYNSLSKKIKSS